jgi:hypothetical protein
MISLSALHIFFYTPKNPILLLIKNSVAEIKIFLVQISGKIRFLEIKVVFQGKKKFDTEIKILLKSKTENSKCEKET